MIFVKSFRVDVRYELSRSRPRLTKSLFSVAEVDVVQHRINDAKPRILCVEEGEFVEIRLGDKLKIRKPFYLYKSCNGEVRVSFVKHGNFVEIRSFRTLCIAKARERGFCNAHLRSEYRAYLSFVFGVSPTLPPEVGLAKLPHMIYAMHVGGDEVKVGIANAIKNVARLYEQAFLHASILAFVPSCAEARKLERALSSMKGVTERITIRDRVRRLQNVGDEDLELALFVSKLHRILQQLCEHLHCRDKPLPVISFSNEIIDRLKHVRRLLCDEHALNTISEGVYEVTAYLPGGIELTDLRDDSKMYIPYQIIRNAALNASLST